MQQQQQVIIVSSLKTRFQREKTTIKVTFFRIDHLYVTFIGNVYNWRIFGVIWMCDNDKKLQRRTMTWRKVARGNLPFSPTLTHTSTKKAVAAGTHRMYFIFFVISLTSDYISKAQHSSLFNVKSSVAARGWLSNVEQALDRPWFRSASSHNPNFPSPEPTMRLCGSTLKK